MQFTEQYDLPDGVIAAAGRHGVAPREVAEVAGGVANRGFVLGDKLFLRVSRPGFEDDLRKETVVVPIALAAGVLTPAILEYDESRSLIDAPYVVMERVHGSEPEDIPAGLAENLARLHAAGPAVAIGVDAHPAVVPGATMGRLGVRDLPVDDGGDPWQIVDDLAARGYLDPGTAKWLTSWFTRLADRFDHSEPKVLIHGDVAAHNLLATPAGELSALIDWGDAAEAPRAMDFAKLPLEHVAALLPDYVHHARSSVREDELAGHVLWFHLAWAVGKLPADPWPGRRHWTAPPGSRLLGLLRFFASAPPAPWSTLT